MGFKVKDHYFKKAKKEKYLARSVYKLDEIDTKYSVIPPKGNILDLGYHPGSWIQYASQKVGTDGHIVGIDIRDINKQLLSLTNVSIYQMDFFDIENLTSLNVLEKFDTLLSDMAPNTTGIKSVDQQRSLNLVERVFEKISFFLKVNGDFVIKVFDSNEAQKFLKSQKKLFKEFYYLKPKSTRSVSKEFFVIGKGFILK